MLGFPNSFIDKLIFKNLHRDAEAHELVGKKIIITNEAHFAHGFLAEISLFSDDTRSGFAKAPCFSMFVTEGDFILA